MKIEIKWPTHDGFIWVKAVLLSKRPDGLIVAQLPSGLEYHHKGEWRKAGKIAA